jgi:hypothetical protein
MQRSDITPPDSIKGDSALITFDLMLACWKLWRDKEISEIVAVCPSETLSAFRAYVRLWTYANLFDHILRGIGCAAALGADSAYPMMTIVSGSLINAFDDFVLGYRGPG